MKTHEQEMERKSMLAVVAKNFHSTRYCSPRTLGSCVSVYIMHAFYMKVNDIFSSVKVLYIA